MPRPVRGTSLGGTVEGGALVFQAGQSLLISSNANNRLDGVAITGDLLLDTTSAVVRIRNGLNISGVVQVSGDSASLAFEGSQTWSAGTVVFEGTTGGRRIIEAVNSSTTLTLGAGLHRARRVRRHRRQPVLRQLLHVGQQRRDHGGRGGPEPGHPQSRDADQQRHDHSGGGHDAEHQRRDLEQCRDDRATGATLSLGGAWSNTGTISATNATVNLGGTFTTVGLGAFNRTLGTVNLTGTLTNSGNTFTYNATTGSWNLVGGTVEGGALVFQAGQSLLISSNANNRLDGVAIAGDLLLDTTSAVVRIRNGLNISGVLHVSGDSASLAFEGSQTWSAGTVVFEGTTGGRRIIEAVNGSTTLTLGAGFTVHGGFGDIGGSRYFGNSFTLANNGAIAADAAGQSLDITSRVTLTNSGTITALAGTTLNINGATWTNAATIGATGATLSLGGAWSNTGTISATNATVNLGGTFTTVGLGAFNRTLGTVNLTGTLTNSGNTFTYNATTGSWNLVGGTVEGGALVFQAGQSLLISSNANNRLDGVAITGDLLLDTTSAVVRIRNGLNVSGVVHVSGDSASLAFEGSQTWSAGTVVFEGTTGGRRIIEAVNGSTTLTLGAGFTVHGGFGDIGGSRYFGNSFTLVNNGAITADVSGQSLDIPSRVTLTNNGTMAAVTGSTLNVNAAVWNSSATLQATGATLSLGGTWSNTGTITATNATVNLGGTFTTAGLGVFNRTLGTVNLTGTLTNTGNTFTYNATTGSWNLAGRDGRGRRTGVPGRPVAADFVERQQPARRRGDHRRSAVGHDERCGADSQRTERQRRGAGERRQRVAGLRRQPDVVGGHRGIRRHDGRPADHRSGQQRHDADARRRSYRARRVRRHRRQPVLRQLLCVGQQRRDHGGRVGPEPGHPQSRNADQQRGDGSGDGIDVERQRRDLEQLRDAAGDRTTLSLGGAWSNTGTITATNATVNLGGTFTTAGLGVFNSDARDGEPDGDLDEYG